MSTTKKRCRQTTSATIKASMVSFIAQNLVNNLLCLSERRVPITCRFHAELFANCFYEFFKTGVSVGKFPFWAIIAASWSMPTMFGHSSDKKTLLQPAHYWKSAGQKKPFRVSIHFYITGGIKMNLLVITTCYASRWTGKTATASPAKRLRSWSGTGNRKSSGSLSVKPVNVAKMCPWQTL